MQPEDSTDRLWTIPNALSVLRLFGVPLFLYLLLGPHETAWALVVLAVSGFTDWLDGVLARALNQLSTLGAMLDPFADRLYILATLVGLVLRHVMPLWLAIVIVGRDAILAVTLPLLRRAGYGPPAVHYLGKAATFCLLYAFPLLLLGTYHGDVAYVARADRVGLHDLGHGALRVGRCGVLPPGDGPDPSSGAAARRRGVVTSRPEPQTAGAPAHARRRRGRARRRCCSTWSTSTWTRVTRRRPAGGAPTRRRALVRPAGRRGRLPARRIRAGRRLPARPPQRAGGGARRTPSSCSACARRRPRRRASRRQLSGVENSLARAAGQRAARRGRGAACSATGWRWARSRSAGPGMTVTLGEPKAGEQPLGRARWQHTDRCDEYPHRP